MSVYVCIPTRDGQIRDEVFAACGLACNFAMRNGIACEIARARNRYMVTTCRNEGVAGFLASQFQSLLFVDDDVIIPEHAIYTLWNAANNSGRDIVSGCVPSIKEPKNAPHYAYVQVWPKGGDVCREWFDGEVEAEAVGGGCMMIRRGVLEQLGHPWFRWPEQYSPETGITFMTEDGDFCARAREAGYRVWAYGNVRCGHRRAFDVAMLLGGR